MKKVIAIFLSAILIMGLAGCGSSAPESTNYNLLGKWTVTSQEKAETSGEQDPSRLGQAMMATAVIMLFSENTSVQFFEDGTIKMGISSGQYRVVDSENLEIGVQNAGSSIMFGMKLEKDTLELDIDKMATIKLTREK